MKKRKGLMYFVFSIIILLFVIKVFSSLYVNYIWFKDLEYTQLFSIPFFTQIGLFLGILLISFTIFYIASRILAKIVISSGKNTISYAGKVIDISQINYSNGEKSIITRKLNLGLLSISGFLGFVVTNAFFENNFTILFLKFINSSSFNITDTVFSKDISFYVFKLPFINHIINIFFVIMSLILFFSFIILIFTGLLNIVNVLRKGEQIINTNAQKFLAVILGIWFILFGIKKYLSVFSVLFSQNGYVFGAGATSINIIIPSTIFLSILCIIIGIICLTYIFKRNHKIIIGTIALYFFTTILVGFVGYAYQNYYVSNNEFVAEKPYIEQELKYTRMAYGVDDIVTREFSGKTDLTIENIHNNKITMDNIRLNDPKALKKVLSQNQGLRYYYTFNDIDIDRYNIDGTYRQLMIAPREMDEESFEGKAETFINQTMRYTHGYGISATLANDFDNSGYARLIVKDVPPTSIVDGIKVTEPRIYFGEKTNDSKYGFVIANTEAKEFDYPQGDKNIENVYEGKTGLKLSGFNKFALSVHYNTFRFYFANEINSDSKLLKNRNIVERVNKLMPYLTYDFDPYIVVGEDGKLYWIIDAYTDTDKFPYSAPFVNGGNYLRNSVKVVVDAYNGTVDFYKIDDEPIVNTYEKVFPNVFKSIDQMPNDIKAHLRYPEGLFRTQLNVLKDFHVTDPSVFYNKEDTWEVAKKADGVDTSYVDPYYIIMKLPEEDKEEFILMSPYTPISRGEQQRNNLVAWFGARCDAPNYGQLVLYKMPKNIEIQGPLMIESIIDQDPDISSRMTLWSQGGSSIIRGNLLAVPIDDGFIYVEPIYIEADREGSSIPQLQAIVVAVDKKVVMVETNNLDEAIVKFFGERELPKDNNVSEEIIEEEPKVEVIDKQNIISKIRSLKDQLDQLEKDLMEIK